MNTPKQFFILLLFTLASLFQAANAIGATITAQVSRSPIAIDETFVLTFEADGEPDDDPDFRPLEKNFDILRRSQSQNVQMTNGRFSRTARWTLSVMAKTTGNLKIPAITFGADRSKAITIQVRDAAQPKSGKAAEDLFLEVSVEPGSAYVRQQLIYRVRLYRSINITDPRLTAPEFNDPDAMVEQLGKEHAYETQRNGKNYLVSQIDYVVFPQTSGTLTLEPMAFQARGRQRPHNRGRFGSPFDMLEQAGPVKRIHSKALSIEIKPIPKDAGKPWLPASNLHLTATWPRSNQEFRVGEPATRTFTLVAVGLTSVQLPEINPKIPAGFKQYPDQPALDDRQDSNNITGIRQEKIALVPTKPGLHTLPAVEIPWWNTATNRQEVARIPEQQIQVLPAPGSTLEAATSGLTPEPAATAAETENLGMPPVSKPAGTPASPKNEGEIYRGLSLFLALGWMVTAIAWWRLGGRPKPAQSVTINNGTVPLGKSRKQCLSDLKRACDANSAEAARPALLAWGATQWRTTPPRGLIDIAMHLNGKAARQVEILERTLYGKGGNKWEGAALWETIQHYKPEQRAGNSADDSLAQLYLS